jgi:hypothetical protein
MKNLKVTIGEALSPEKMKGIVFTEIIPEFLSEFNPKKLVELGAIVREKGRTQMYEPLTDSLGKIQWVKLVGLKAIAIDKEIAGDIMPNTFFMDPLGQTAHALCVTDCLIHTKSALDSMAIFLTSLLNLDVKGGERDFKKPKFRQLIAEKDLFLKHKIKKLEHWFKQLQEIRDEWIHRRSIRSRLIHGRSKVGMLPIPKKVALSHEEQIKLPITEEHFWSTKNFVEYHYTNLLTLFLAIVERCIQIERKDYKKSVPLFVLANVKEELTIFPIQAAENMVAEYIMIRLRESTVDW